PEARVELRPQATVEAPAAPKPEAPVAPPMPETPRPEVQQPQVDSRALAALNRNCAMCHTGARAKGKTQIFLSPGVLNPNAPKPETAEALTPGKMPPMNRPRPSADEVAALKQWLAAAN